MSTSDTAKTSDPRPTSALHAAQQLIIPQAAAIATIITKSLLHPIDTMKVRVQSQPNTNLRALFKQYQGQWGPSYLYAGLPIKLALYAPYQSLYMSAYTYTKTILYHYELSAPSPSSDDLRLLANGTSRPRVVPNKSLEALCGSVAAEFACAGIRVPMEAIKMRLQASVATNTKTAANDLWQHGIRKVSRLFVPQTLCHDLPYSITQWMMYEHLRPVLHAKAKVLTDESERRRGVIDANSRFRWWMGKTATFLTGASSGLVTGIVTVPLDVVKTRVVVESHGTGKVAGFFHTGREIIRKEGVSSLMRGGAWRVLWITSNSACFFPVFEAVKEVLGMESPK